MIFPDATVTPLSPSTGVLDLASVHRDGQIYRDHYRVAYAVIVHDREGVDLTDCDRYAVVAFNPDGTVRELHRSDAHSPAAAMADALAAEETRRATAEKVAIAERMARVAAPPGAIALTCRAHEYAQQWSARQGGCCPVCGAEGAPLVIAARVRPATGGGVWIEADGSVVLALDALGIGPDLVRFYTPQRAVYAGPWTAEEIEVRLREIGWLRADESKGGLRVVRGGAP